MELTELLPPGSTLDDALVNWARRRADELLHGEGLDEVLAALETDVPSATVDLQRVLAQAEVSHGEVPQRDMSDVSRDVPKEPEEPEETELLEVDAEELELVDDEAVEGVDTRAPADVSLDEPLVGLAAEPPGLAGRARQGEEPARGSYDTADMVLDDVDPADFGLGFEDDLASASASRTLTRERSGSTSAEARPGVTQPLSVLDLDIDDGHEDDLDVDLG